jgi:hypothetical protein
MTCMITYGTIQSVESSDTQRALSGFVYQISAEYKIGMSSICKIPGIVAYSVQIPDVPIRFSIHGTGQCPL